MSVEQLFAQRHNHIKPTAIRQLFTLLQRPNLISFAGGWPAPDLFPNEAIANISHDILMQEANTALQYGGSRGNDRLLAIIRQRLAQRYHMHVEPEEIMITSGAQQGIYLTTSLLLDKGDFVAVEAPTFLGTFGAVNAFQGKMVGIPMDQNGLDVDVLETHCQHTRIKFVYVIPEFQNPTGLTMSLERRLRLIELAEQYNFMILEDSPYSDLRYEGTPMPPIYQLDRYGRTIYLGSFSKTFTPMRVGWLCAPKKIVAKMTATKMAVDVCTPVFTQAITYHFIARGLLDKHIDTLCHAYQQKRDIMLQALKTFMPTTVRWTKPQGGMFIWVTLPNHIDATKLFHRVLNEKNVAFVIGSAFYPNEKVAPHNVFRLNFITPNEDEIWEGIRRLADVVSSYEPILATPPLQFKRPLVHA